MNMSRKIQEGEGCCSYPPLNGPMCICCKRKKAFVFAIFHNYRLLLKYSKIIMKKTCTHEYIIWLPQVCMEYWLSVSWHLCSLISIFVIRSIDSTIPNFKTLASFWSWAGQFESYLVANPEDRFSCTKDLLFQFFSKVLPLRWPLQRLHGYIWWENGYTTARRTVLLNWPENQDSSFVTFWCIVMILSHWTDKSGHTV